MPRPENLHFLVSQSGSRFVAHCLDYDLVASADTHHEAIRRLNFVVAAHVKTAEDREIRAALEHQAPESF